MLQYRSDAHRLTTELRLRGLRPLRRNRRRRSWHVWEEAVVAGREPVDGTQAPVRNSKNVRRQLNDVADSVYPGNEMGSNPRSEIFLGK